MVKPRAFVLLIVLVVGSALVSACDRSPTAPQLQAVRPLATVAPEPFTAIGQPARAAQPAGGAGTALDLAARPAEPVHSRLEVPGGTSTAYQMTQQAVGGEYTLRVDGRATEAQAQEPAPGDDPIVLTLDFPGPEATRALTVEFVPADAAEPTVVRVTLVAGQTTTLRFRRGRSKYSVIYF